MLVFLIILVYLTRMLFYFDHLVSGLPKRDPLTLFSTLKFLDISKCFLFMLLCCLCFGFDICPDANIEMPLPLYIAISNSAVLFAFLVTHLLNHV